MQCVNSLKEQVQAKKCPLRQLLPVVLGDLNMLPPHALSTRLLRLMKGPASLDIWRPKTPTNNPVRKMGWLGARYVRMSDREAWDVLDTSGYERHT